MIPSSSATLSGKIAKHLPANAPTSRPVRVSDNLLTVCIVDDEENDRLTMRRTAESSSEFRCIGLHSNAREALREIPRLRPDVVLLDIRMPGMDGLECAVLLKVAMPELKIVVVTGLLDTGWVDKSCHAGADAYLTKPISAAQCVATLKFSVHTELRWGKEPWGFHAGGHAVVGMPETGFPLTVRENDVMNLVEKGFLYKEMAAKLGISFSTVHYHLHRIYQKLHAGNRTEAVIKRWDAHKD